MNKTSRFGEERVDHKDINLIDQEYASVDLKNHEKDRSKFYQQDLNVLS